MKKLTQYNKALVAAVAVILTGLNVLYADNNTVQLVIAIAGALGVYAVPNKQVTK